MRTFNSQLHLVLTIVLACSVSFAVDREDNESERNRSGKIAELSIFRASGGSMPDAMSGITAGYFLNLNEMIFVEIAMLYNTRGENTFAHFLRSGNSVGFHYRKFLGNSWNISPGIDYRTIHVNDFWDAGPDSFSRSFKGTSTALNFQIGNQWQWEYVTFKVDWIGVSYPVSHEITESKSSSQSNPQGEAAELQRDQDRFVRKPTWNLLKLGLGWSF